MGEGGLLLPSTALRSGQKVLVLSYHERNTRLMFMDSVVWFPERDTLKVVQKKGGFLVSFRGIREPERHREGCWWTVWSSAQ